MGEMLRTCQYCSGYHRIGERCPQHKRLEYKTKQTKFRNSGRWQRTRQTVKERDMQLCRVCLTNKHETQYAYNSKELEVHHIVPLSEDMELGHEPDNLITLCRFHHQLVHSGGIKPAELKRLIGIPPTPYDP